MNSEISLKKTFRISYLDYVENYVDKVIFSIKDYGFIKRFVNHCEDKGLMEILRKYNGMSLNSMRDFYGYIERYMVENEIDLYERLNYVENYDEDDRWERMERYEEVEDMPYYNRDMSIMFYNTMIDYLEEMIGLYSKSNLNTTQRKNEERNRHSIYLRMIILLFCLRMGIKEYDDYLYLKERIYLSFKKRRLVLTKNEIYDFEDGKEKEIDSLTAFNQFVLDNVKNDFDNVDDYDLGIRERNNEIEDFVNYSKCFLFEPYRKEILMTYYDWSESFYNEYVRLVDGVKNRNKE